MDIGTAAPFVCPVLLGASAFAVRCLFRAASNNAAWPCPWNAKARAVRQCVQASDAKRAACQAAEEKGVPDMM